MLGSVKVPYVAESPAWVPKTLAAGWARKDDLGVVKLRRAEHGGGDGQSEGDAEAADAVNPLRASTQ